MNKSMLGNVAPDFKRVLAMLPMDRLVDMQSCFMSGLRNKRDITNADRAIIISFDDEKTHRKMKGDDWNI